MNIGKLTHLGGFLAVCALTALPASAGTSFQAYEIDNPPVFTGNGGPGSTITVTATLVNPNNHSQSIGTKNEFCIITGFSSTGHRLLWCFESLVFNDKGTLFAQGHVDETLIEAGVPQSEAIFAGSGIYAGETGTEVLQQVVFPNQFILTLELARVPHRDEEQDSN